MKRIFNLLKKINESPGINQRALSMKCEISLGKVNSLIEDLEFNKFITKEINGREHRYFINTKGLDYLEKELENNKDIQLKLHNSDSKAITKGVILSAGRNKNFDIPVSLLKIGEVPLIERMIEILKRNGISDIFVVVGYNAEMIKEKLGNTVTIIKNDDYKWTGTMASLSKVKEYIEDDFILVEGDIVIEESGIKEIINNKNRDCILITSESGSGDEGFVEIKDDRVYKISKDIAQLNKIDGEMIGISKISYEFFSKMMEVYRGNNNPYMNYEYMMLDISKIYSLGYIKLDNLLWHEVDTVDHYNYVKSKLLNKIERKEKSILAENLQSIICECMNIEMNRIKDISPIGGMTNKNYKVQVDDELYVLRVPGNGTEEMISREEEIKNAVYANKIGVDAELVYFNEKTGIKISKFIDNAETLTPEAAKRQSSMKMVTDVIKKLHGSDIPMNTNFDIYNKIEKYEELLKKFDGKNFDDYYEVKDKVLHLKTIVNELDVKLVPCHNDLVSENFVKSGNERMYLIDWEYGGMNDAMWDLAAYCLENGLSAEEEELFLKIYFEREVEEKYKKRILINKIYQDFLWSLWTNIKEAKGDDFGSYGIDRYNRAKNNIKIILEGDN